MLPRSRHTKAAAAANMANPTRKTQHAMPGNYDVWGALKSNSTAEKELSWAYDARLFAIRRRNEARRRQTRDLNQPLIKVG
jgi:hypothetical protein